MRVRLSDPSVAPRLLAFLAGRHDSVVARVSETDIEVSLVGSLAADAAEAELERRLEGWRTAHPDVETVIVDDAVPAEWAGRRHFPTR